MWRGFGRDAQVAGIVIGQFLIAPNAQQSRRAPRWWTCLHWCAMTEFNDRRACEFGDLLRSMPDCASDGDFERIRNTGLPVAAFIEDDR